MRYATYEILEEAALPAGLLDLVKEQLRIDPSDTSQDTYLTLLTQSAIKYGELYTHRTFFNVKFRTFRLGFCGAIYNTCFELRRSKFQTLESFEYIKDGGWIAVDSASYYITDSTDYSSILLADGFFWPDDADKREQNIRIDFTAGFGVDLVDLPQDLLNAVLAHVAALYENRGDCDTASVNGFLPNESKIIYDLRKIPNITGLPCY